MFFPTKPSYYTLEVVEEIFSGGIFFDNHYMQKISKTATAFASTTIHTELSVGDVYISPHAPNTQKKAFKFKSVEQSLYNFTVSSALVTGNAQSETLVRVDHFL